MKEELNALHKRRLSLLEQLVTISTEIKGIDLRLSVLKSAELESDLIQAAEKAVS